MNAIARRYSRLAPLCVIGLLVGCSSAPPSRSQLAGASASESAVPSVDELTRYTNRVFSFDYPAAWPVITESIGEVRHYEWIPIVLGTGEWELNCDRIPPSGDSLGGVSCGADIFTVDPGEVVVEVHLWMTPFGEETPPPNAVMLPAGLPAVVTDTSRTSLWRIYLAGYPQPLVVDARFAGPDGERLRAQVRRLVESIVFTAPSS
jgi:hypothetical protein